MSTTQVPQTRDVMVEADKLAASADSPQELMQAICDLLNDRMLKYNWVGFYMLEETRGEPMLVLGPFVGAMTPHTRIPLNQGLCGAAASSGDTVIVDDVNSDPRYLACSVETQSEIVVPIMRGPDVLGEIDVDSDRRAAFGLQDRETLEAVAALLSEKL